DDVKSFMIGAVAPDFEQNTPEGNPMKLSDLRGKVVLVDFWASWCGPCRRENPNVVRLYNQYKDQGFEVLGVSLDKGKEKWLKAIEKDGLTWQHVSDLRGWGNTVAKQYSVRSIPHTLLLDQEGRILAKNLRGPELAKKLAEIFKE
ncbi:MAG: TlpA disulfide reductase family protein, partial [Bacteroidota bacterium]